MAYRKIPMGGVETAESYELLGELIRRSPWMTKRDKAKPIVAIIFGPPGCGKGTASEWLKSDYGFCHISTGDALREEVASGSALGEQVKAVVAAGQLVSDDLILQIVAGKMKSAEQAQAQGGAARATGSGHVTGGCAGFLFDGYPRTLAQAKGLDEMLEKRNTCVDIVINLECSRDLLKTRICGRRVHPASGRVYHVTNKPPKIADKDDVTGEPLVTRPDDNETALTARLEAFDQQTKPILEYYRPRQVLHTLDANEESATIRRWIHLLLQI